MKQYSMIEADSSEKEYITNEENIRLDCDVSVRASDEYTTTVKVRLPSGQRLFLYVNPDYVDEPHIIWALLPSKED
jgi:hypothetical protein